MSQRDVEVAIVGGGVAGLAAAHECLALGKEFLVFEAGVRPGGMLQSENKGGYCFERGANVFRVPEPLAIWLDHHGLNDGLVPAGHEAGRRAVFLDGKLIWLPHSIVGLVMTPLLSLKGKIRALAEAFMLRGALQQETVAQFIVRRFGSEALRRAVAPFLIGVYAGDEFALGAEAVFPTLRDYECRYGSVLRGVAANLWRSNRHRMRGSYGGRYGLGGWAKGVADRLGGSLCLGRRVVNLSTNGSSWCLDFMSEHERIRADTVILAVPSEETARLLSPLDTEAMELLSQIDYACLVNVHFGFECASSRELIQGFGYLISREADLELLGALFPSRVFPNRAPSGCELLSAMIGGVRWPGAIDADDAEILKRTRQGLETTLGLQEEGEVLDITRWRRAVPQPGPEHPKRIRSLRARLGKHLPGIHLAGSYLDGVGVGDTMLSGIKAAQTGGGYQGGR